MSIILNFPHHCLAIIISNKINQFKLKCQMASSAVASAGNKRKYDTEFQKGNLITKRFSSFSVYFCNFRLRKTSKCEMKILPKLFHFFHYYFFFCFFIFWGFPSIESPIDGEWRWYCDFRIGRKLLRKAKHLKKNFFPPRFFLTFLFLFFQSIEFD